MGHGRRETKTHDHNSMRRSSGFREQRRVIIISGEGQTERTYFDMRVFKELGQTYIKQPKGTSSTRTRTNPRSVIKRALDTERSVRKGGLLPGDQVWVVVDTDQWNDEDRNALREFERSHKSHHVAVSNPKIELFILMHFENADGCTTAAIVDRRLRKHWPKYDKIIPSEKFSKKDVLKAAERGKRKYATDPMGYPVPGSTGLFSLIEWIATVESGRYGGVHPQNV